MRRGSAFGIFPEFPIYLNVPPHKEWIVDLRLRRPIERPAQLPDLAIASRDAISEVGSDTETFALALRAALRQAPKVILVGEMRDRETVEAALTISETGHLVFTTLHTNSAAETLTRLRNMGVPAFNLATSVNLIIAQRLARRLCPNCKEAMDVPKETLLAEGFTEADLTQQFEVFEANPNGCDKCKDGYKGRVGIYEVVKITPEMQRIIMEDGNSMQIAAQAKELGFNDLRRSGLMKVMQGVTSLKECNRVTTGH